MEPAPWSAIRPENATALTILTRLDASLFDSAECFFAGGTAISLRCGEHRVSRDVDFLCASRDGYRLLRQRVFAAGARGFFAHETVIVREPRVDRYGIRFVVAEQTDAPPLKVEIVSEGRIDLVGTTDPALPVRRVVDSDLVASKLLANADRFLDEGSTSRDVIDLIVLEHAIGKLPDEAWQKARAAYGDSVDSAYERALDRLRDRADERARCFRVLDVSPDARAIVEAKLAGR